MEVYADQESLWQVNLFRSGEKLPGNVPNGVTSQAAQQLQEYFRGTRQQFELPLSLRGTTFQKKVWNALGQIPYGELRSYGEIARVIRHPKAYRAVGMANHRNPLMIIIPCHRVIGAAHKLVGYAHGLQYQQWLLDFEGGPGTVQLPEGVNNKKLSRRNQE